MKLLFAIIALFCVAQGAPATSQQDEAVSTRDLKTDSSAAQGVGIVHGAYTMALPDGRTRTVKYTTDKNGFHATVLTNELEPSKARNSRDLAAQASVISAAETLLKGAAVFLRDVTSDPSGDGIYIQKMF